MPGKLEWNWVGNTHAEFVDDQPSGTGRWVQNFVDEIEVTPDGTVIAGCFWDDFVSPGAKDPAIESTVTLAQGLPNMKHTLEISGGDATPIAAFRAYRPAWRGK